jgi:hypothetical protein
MRVVAGEPSKVTNRTVVVSASGGECTRATPTDLRAAINGWDRADGALLCGRMAKRSGPGQQAAKEVLSRLSQAGLDSWWVEDLVDALKQALLQFASTKREPDPEPPLTRPVEDKDVVRLKADRTRAAIERLPHQRKVKDHLLCLGPS